MHVPPSKSSRQFRSVDYGWLPQGMKEVRDGRQNQELQLPTPVARSTIRTWHASDEPDAKRNGDEEAPLHGMRKGVPTRDGWWASEYAEASEGSKPPDAVDRVHQEGRKKIMGTNPGPTYVDEDGVKWIRTGVMSNGVGAYRRANDEAETD